MSDKTIEVGEFGVLVQISELPDEETEARDRALAVGVEEDGIVSDTVVETRYCPIQKMILTDTFLRVIGDDGFTDVEIRIPLTELRALLQSKETQNG